MKFEPGKFYLGVIDFFSIMLPGGVLSYFLYGAFCSDLFGPLFPPIETETGQWVILIFASYLLGHIVFLAGSILDFMLYDPIRKVIWRGSSDLTYPAATAIKKKYGRAVANEKIINTFQWAKAMLLLNHPAAMAEVARLEADSKFFRSLAVVLAILAAVVFFRGQIVFGGVFVFLLLLSFARYVERRRKSVMQACYYVITLSGLAKRK